MALVLLPSKNLDLSQRYFPTYSISNLQLFSGNLLSLSLITAIAKYIYCQNYELLRALSQNNVTFNFQSFLPNHAKMAAILIICCIFQKVILVIFCFVICFLLTIYVSKYLQFPLNTSTDCQNHVTVHAFVEDNGRSNFSFLQFFIFSTLEGFSKKTYEQTCRFYNIFSNSSSNCMKFYNLDIFFKIFMAVLI